MFRVGHDFLGQAPLYPIDAEGLIRKAAKDPEKARRVLVVAARKMPVVKYGSLEQEVRRIW